MPLIGAAWLVERHRGQGPVRRRRSTSATSHGPASISAGGPATSGGGRPRAVRLQCGHGRGSATSRGGSVVSGRERLRRLAPPFVLLLAVVALARSWPVAARFVPADDAALVAMLLRAAAGAAGAQLVVSLLDILVWHGLVERRAGRPAPRLLRDVGAALVWVAAACLVAAEVFGW